MSLCLCSQWDHQERPVQHLRPQSHVVSSQERRGKKQTQIWHSALLYVDGSSSRAEQTPSVPCFHQNAFTSSSCGNLITPSEQQNQPNQTCLSRTKCCLMSLFFSAVCKWLSLSGLFLCLFVFCTCSICSVEVCISGLGFLKRNDFLDWNEKCGIRCTLHNHLLN